MALTDYVIMPGADYQDACDAIRERDGSTGVIKSGELGERIRSLAGVQTCRLTVVWDATRSTAADEDTWKVRVPQYVAASNSFILASRTISPQPGKSGTEVFDDVPVGGVTAFTWLIAFRAPTCEFHFEKGISHMAVADATIKLAQVEADARIRILCAD